MAGRILGCLSLVLALGTTAVAQGRVEISGFGGYTFSEGINVDPNSSLGILVREINPPSGPSYGASVNVAIDDDGNLMVGFLLDQHQSDLELKGTGGAGNSPIDGATKFSST